MYVGINTAFGQLHIDIIHGNGGKAHQPPVGQFAVERHAASAACTCSKYGGIGACFHVHDKGVGGTVAVAVGQYDDGFLPAYAFGGRQCDGFRRREGGMPLAGLVADVAACGLFIDETFRQGLRGGKLSAAVITDIKNQSCAYGKMREYGAEIATTEAIFKRRTIDIADVAG